MLVYFPVWQKHVLEVKCFSQHGVAWGLLFVLGITRHMQNCAMLELFFSKPRLMLLKEMADKIGNEHPVARSTTFLICKY